MRGAMRSEPERVEISLVGAPQQNREWHLERPAQRRKLADTDLALPGLDGAHGRLGDPELICQISLTPLVPGALGPHVGRNHRCEIGHGRTVGKILGTSTPLNVWHHDYRCGRLNRLT